MKVLARKAKGLDRRAKVKEINMVKKHVKTTKEKKGGIFPKESFIHISNLKLIDEKMAKKKFQIEMSKLFNCIYEYE